MSDKFLWGGASASYQCEGAWNLDDKAESMWGINHHNLTPSLTAFILHLYFIH